MPSSHLQISRHNAKYSWLSCSSSMGAHPTASTSTGVTHRKSARRPSPIDTSKPVKRRRVQPLTPEPSLPESLNSNDSHSKLKDGPSKSTSSDTDIWKWTLSHDAIARCSVSDILNMRESETKGVLSRNYVWNMYMCIEIGGQGWISGGSDVFRAGRSSL